MAKYQLLSHCLTVSFSMPVLLHNSLNGKLGAEDEGLGACRCRLSPCRMRCSTSGLFSGPVACERTVGLVDLLTQSIKSL